MLSKITEEGLLEITLNRPRKMNSFTPAMYDELTRLLKDANTNDKIKVVLL